MAARKKTRKAKRKTTGVLTPTLKQRSAAGRLVVTPEMARANPKERGRVGLTPLGTRGDAFEGTGTFTRVTKRKPKARAETRRRQ